MRKSLHKQKNVVELTRFALRTAVNVTTRAARRFESLQYFLKWNNNSLLKLLPTRLLLWTAF